VTAPLARVVRTCTACPSQWDAWTTSGQYLYLRYRFGRGTVDAYDTADDNMMNLIKRVPGQCQRAMELALEMNG